MTGGFLDILLRIRDSAAKRLLSNGGVIGRIIQSSKKFDTRSGAAIGGKGIGRSAGSECGELRVVGVLI